MSGGAQTNNGWYPATISVSTGNTPVIAARPSSGFACLISTSVSNGTATYTYFCSAAGITLSYWVFDDPALLNPTEQYGLIVRNAASLVVFDSRFSYMRIVGDYSGAESVGSAAIDNGVSYSYSGTPAVVQSALRHSWAKSVVSPAPPYPQMGLFNAAAFSISGSNVSFQTQTINSFYDNTGQVVIDTTPCNAYAYLVLDVTNM